MHRLKALYAVSSAHASRAAWIAAEYSRPCGPLHERAARLSPHFTRSQAGACAMQALKSAKAFVSAQRSCAVCKAAEISASCGPSRTEAGNVATHDSRLHSGLWARQ